VLERGYTEKNYILLNNSENEFLLRVYGFCFVLYFFGEVAHYVFVQNQRIYLIVEEVSSSVVCIVLSRPYIVVRFVEHYTTILLSEMRNTC